MNKKDNSVSDVSVSAPSPSSFEDPLYDRWPVPQEIKSDLPRVQLLPIGCLPDSIRPWIKDVSERLQVPPDYVANPFLVMISSVIGASCRIRPKLEDDFEVVPNLWGGIIGAPSTKKSPAIDEALRPLCELEKMTYEQFEQEKSEFEAQLQIHLIEEKKAKSDLENIFSKHGGEHLGELQENARCRLENIVASEPTEPRIRRFRTSDTTIEKLCEILVHNDNGILVFRDELTGLLMDLEKKGQESARATYLQSFNGSNQYLQDRIGRGSIKIKNLCVSLLGGIQPIPLKHYLQKFLSSQNDGFFQRFQLLVYPDTIDISWVDRQPDKEAFETVQNLVTNLAFEDFGSLGAERSIDGHHFFRLDQGAFFKYRAWSERLEERIRFADSPIMEQHLGKFRSLIPSLALIFHLCELAAGSLKGPVSIRALDSAIRYSDYLESHAKRIYALSTNPLQDSVIELAKKIENGKLEDGFSVRDIYRNCWHLLKEKRQVEAVCEELHELGWIKPQSKRSRSVKYSINPRVPINPQMSYP